MAVAGKAPSSALQPDPEQQRAIEHVHGPMLVVAGAGTGKTTVLIRRIVSLIQNGHARPEEILALTYTTNAAQEMLDRVGRELRQNLKGLEVSTFHAYSNQLLMRQGQNFNVLDDKQLWIFLRRRIRDLHLNYFVRAANTAKFLDDLLDFIRRCHDELVGPDEYSAYVRRLEGGELPVPRVGQSKDQDDERRAEETLGRSREIAAVFLTVERMLAERNLGTFGHMIVRANHLLEGDPSLLARERARARFILVDEFQDANFAQIKLLSTLAGAERNVFAVGDPDQGIYRFRGASSGAFELFQHHFPQSKLVSLARNRRSTTPILECAHALISRNPEFMLPSGGSQYRRVLLVSVRDQDGEAKLKPRAAVEAVFASGSFMEAQDLVSTLVEHRRRSRCRWRDIGVLYRIHTHRDEVAAELDRRGIPFSIEGLDVLDTPEARDLIASLAATVSPGETSALLRVAALNQFSIPPDELRATLSSLPRQTKSPMAAALGALERGGEILEKLTETREAIAGRKIHDALVATSVSFQIPPTPPVETLLEFSKAWETSPMAETGSPTEFLEYLDDFREARGIIPLGPADEGDRVRLMSVHGAKGLEFDHVFMLRAVKGSFPCHYREAMIEVPAELRHSGMAEGEEKKIYEQEERRLFYVAMTRARDTLTIYGPLGRGERDKTPPGFLRELVKRRELKPYFRHRTCREFQTGMFAAPEAGKISRLAEWVALRPASDLASRLSASAIDRYRTCPLQFKLEREWRIPSEISAAVEYGASVHRVLLAYFDSLRWNRALSSPELVERFRADLASEAITDPYQRELYQRQGVTQLREFVAGVESAPPEVLHTEEQFSMKIGQTMLAGRIDRIDRAPNDRVIITDYKTGKPKSQDDADHSLQLSLYALAAREKWGYQAENLVFHNLDGNTRVKTVRSDRELDEAREMVIEVAAQIAEGNFEPTPGFHCAWCSYRFLCPKTEKHVPEPLSMAEAARSHLAHKI